MTCWLNGHLVGAKAARIDPGDRGYTLGDGLFETVRIAGGQPVRLQRHLDRLHVGAALLEIPVPWSRTDLAGAFSAVAAANHVGEGVARLTLSRGPGQRGVLPPGTVRPTMLITAASFIPPVVALHAVTCRTTRRNEMSPLSRIKSLNYLDGILARMEAGRRGADDAILLNTHGLVAEASAANIVILRNGVLLTPPVADGALPGILRALLIERCGVIETSLPPEELPGAEALYFTNSLGIRAVASLDGQPLARRDDILAELRLRAFATV